MCFVHRPWITSHRLHDEVLPLRYITTCYSKELLVSLLVLGVQHFLEVKTIKSLMKQNYPVALKFPIRQVVFKKHIDVFYFPDIQYYSPWVSMQVGNCLCFTLGMHGTTWATADVASWVLYHIHELWASGQHTACVLPWVLQHKHEFPGQVGKVCDR